MSKDLIAFDSHNKGMITALKAMCHPDLTDDEFRLGVALVSQTGLNPLKKECWILKLNGRVVVTTGIAGYHAIANRHPDYDGMVSEMTRDQDGKPIVCRVSVYRKDRRYPSVAEATLKESYKSSKYGNGPWDTSPSAMLEIAAERKALRKAFPLELSVFEEGEIGAELPTSPPNKFFYALPAEDKLGLEDKRIIFKEMGRLKGKYNEHTRTYEVSSRSSAVEEILLKADLREEKKEEVVEG